MATPPGQLTPTLQVEYLARALREATDREVEYRKLLQVFMGRCSKAEAKVRRLEELCRDLKTNARVWENNGHHAISSKKAHQAHFCCEKRSRAMAEKARLEEKVKLPQQDQDAKDVKPADLPVTAEHIHIGILQTENADLLDKQEKLEEELSRTTSSASETLQHVTATVLALVAEVEKSQPGEMFARHVKLNVVRKRQRPAVVSTHEDSTSSSALEQSKRACYESIRRAEAALVDATWVWKRAQSEAECMLTVGRKTIVDKILGRAEARQ